jgi:hypothetical protein
MSLENIKFFLEHAAAQARHFKILDEIAYRDLCIKIEFEEMKKVRTGESNEIFINELKDKYFLSLDRMRHICYPSAQIEDIEPLLVPRKVLIKSGPARRRI